MDRLKIIAIIIEAIEEAWQGEDDINKLLEPNLEELADWIAYVIEGEYIAADEDDPDY